MPQRDILCFEITITKEKGLTYDELVKNIYKNLIKGAYDRSEKTINNKTKPKNIWIRSAF